MIFAAISVKYYLVKVENLKYLIFFQLNEKICYNAPCASICFS